MQKYSLEVIGTHLGIMIDTNEDCTNIFRAIRVRLSDFEGKYSRFIPDNWLALLNKHRSATLGEDARNMLSFALEVAQKTHGYFDPTIGKRLTELGYGNKDLTIVKNDFGGFFGDYRDIIISGSEVQLGGGIELEFGGVGKGYLIDIIKGMIDNSITPPNLPPDQVRGRLLSGEEPKRFLINFGGDLYGRGGWEVGLESPFAVDEVIGTIVLQDGFLACSSGTKRKWGNHHHLIDPHTGESARDVAASYIEGSSGMTVDAYATALCVMPWDQACSVFTSLPEISGVLVSREGNIFQKLGSRAQLFQ